VFVEVISKFRLDPGSTPGSSTVSKRSLIVKVRQSSACNNGDCKP